MTARVPPLLSGRRPIVMLGQSNIAGGYQAISEWPSRLRYAQGTQASCHSLVCYGPASTPVNAPSVDATWKPIAPFVVTAGDMAGQQVGSWALDLADGLRGAGVDAAMCRYCVGGTVLEYWTKGASGSSYATILAWVQARLAELSSPLEPIFVFYQGESGSFADYGTLLGTMIAGWRTDMSLPNAKFVIVQIPATYAPAASVAAAQAAYVATDENSVLAYAHDSTFVATAPAGLHIDQASGRRLAVGPNSGTTVKSVLSCILGLL